MPRGYPFKVQNATAKTHAILENSNRRRNLELKTKPTEEKQGMSFPRDGRRNKTQRETGPNDRFLY